MSTDFQPDVGDWYQNSNGDTFEVVAYDEDDQTLEVQYFDGTVEELDMDTWRQLDINPIEPPEDWSGSLDIEREDYGIDRDEGGDNGWTNPLDRLDRQE